MRILAMVDMMHTNKISSHGLKKYIFHADPVPKSGKFVTHTTCGYVGVHCMVSGRSDDWLKSTENKHRLGVFCAK